MGRNLRKPKQEMILEHLKEAERQGHEINKEKFINYYCFKFEAARRTIIEYIKAAIEHGRLKIKWENEN